MARLLLAAATLAVLSLSASARADQPEPPVAGPPSPSHAANAMHAPKEESVALPPSLMRVFDALVVVGIAELDTSATLITQAVGSDDPLPLRAPTWLSPEPPKTPLLYSRVMQLKF
jgi:hypothetical protein